MVLPLVLIGGIAAASAIYPISSAVGRRISPPNYNAGQPTAGQNINKGLDTIQIALLAGGAYMLLKKK